MAIPEHEREHLRRIGVYKAASHREAQERHRSLPLDERIARSWQLFLNGRADTSGERRDDDPARFYARARALGLYQP